MSVSPNENLTFEQSLAELDRIVRELEDGQLGLEDALGRYENGVGLLKRCYAQLQTAEQRILLLTGANAAGEPITEPFEHAATAAPLKEEPKRRKKKTDEPEILFSSLPEDGQDLNRETPWVGRQMVWAEEIRLFDDLSHYLDEERALVEGYLRTAIRSVVGCPPALAEAMGYSLMAPGKRLRPLLVILASEACGGRDEDAVPAACAVEMIHTYSLIHDDLPAMDDDDLRRGLPTCHKKFGEALAILTGDSLLTLAFGVLADGYPPSTAAACCRELASGAGASGMVGGQVEDLAWEREDDGRPGPPRSLQVLENIHARKTGALFRACLRLGIWATQGEKPGGPEPELLASLDAYGRCFGQAFQITDDLLDVEGHAEQTGKRVQKDAARGKLTYPGFLGVEESRRLAEKLCEEAGRHLRPLGRAGDRLAALAQSIVRRKR